MRDYCSRAFVEVAPLELDCAKVPSAAYVCLPARAHLFSCTIMRGYKQTQTELILCAESETDRQRWLAAMRPPTVSY